MSYGVESLQYLSCMSDIYLHGLCSSTSQDWSLWSTKIGWDTPDPDITLCFQYTILNWVPLLFLWVSCSIYIPMIQAKGNVIYYRTGKFNIFKSTLIAFLLLIHIVNLCKTIGQTLSKLSLPPAMYLQPVLSAISSILLIYLNRLIFLKGIHTSGVLFFYWLLQFLANLMIIYSRYRRLKIKDPDIFRTVTATLEFVLVLGSLVSNFFADQAVFQNLKKDILEKDYNESHPLFKGIIGDKSVLHTSEGSPGSRASFLSKLTHIWITGLMVKGYRKPLTFDDLYTLEEESTSRKILPKIEEEWNKELEKAKNRKRREPGSSDQFKVNYQKLKDEDSSTRNQDLLNKTSTTPSFAKALFHTVGYPYLAVGCLRLFYDLLAFVQALILGQIIQFIENPEEHSWHGYVFALCCFCVSMIQSIIIQKFYYMCYLSGMRARTATLGIIYRKALKMSPTSRKEAAVDGLVNLMSVDSQRIHDAFLYLHYLWSFPATMIIAIIFLWYHIGYSVLAGFAFLVCLTPINVLLAMKIKGIQVMQMKMKDNRMKIITEILNGMKILKLYAWENLFLKIIGQKRYDECCHMRTTALLYAIMGLSWFCAPFVITLCTFFTYILTNPSNILTTSKALICLTIFNVLNIQLSMIPDSLVCITHARVSLQRINQFLLIDELDQYNVDDSLCPESEVTIIDGTFSWNKDEIPFLMNINIDIEQGSLIAVVGAVGSGKTSLASALIGEMFKLSGQVKCRGSVAYVPQQAWCLNASVKDNILFNKPMNAYQYNRVIEACALLEDLKDFPSGDETEIGERGINLSGGQKQRISLARAVYQDSSIYILDDPLSAVDSHVGKHIFHQVIGPNGLLSSKTRVLITHGLTYLPKVDKIFVMRDLIISESGSFEELLNNNGPFAELIKTYLEQDDEDAEMSNDEDNDLTKSIRQKIPGISGTSSFSRQSSMRSSVSEKSIRGQKEEIKISQNDKLIQEEFVEISGVKWNVYLSYIRSATYPVAIVVLVSYILCIVFAAGNKVFLGNWIETEPLNGTSKKGSLDFFLGIYGGFGACQIIFTLIQILSLAHGTVSASKAFHSKLLTNILRAPSIFFDTTPVGRILNRIGKDIDTLDANIFPYFRHWLITLALVLESILVIIITYPYFIIALIPLTLVFIVVQMIYVKSSTQIKRIEAIRRSPIYSHFQESLAGASSIRAYQVEKYFIDKCDALIDDSSKPLYSGLVSMRCLQFYTESIGNMTILLVALLSVVTRSTIGAGMVGLSISLSLQMSWSSNYMVQMTCELETNIVSVERIQDFINVEQEAPWNIEETKPDPDWPARGEIEFVNYSVRYRPGLDLVLKNLNFVVHAGEKLGIVGRTGAGKSSLFQALFRLIEPAEGSISIDGVNISGLGLHNLRSKISIIPQDPVIFCGTLRMNLDPFDEYSDVQLWNVLEMAHLKSFITSSSEGLNFQISNRGENLSVGQRQLVSLARVLLRRTRILILDEATSAIDLESDDLIQRSIRDQFKDCTVLTVAHRINTIMDYNRVLVLQQGAMLELDSPQNLLRNTKSIFYSMAKDAGLA